VEFVDASSRVGDFVCHMANPLPFEDSI
jgi:hypothetical protein